MLLALALSSFPQAPVTDEPLILRGAAEPVTGSSAPRLPLELPEHCRLLYAVAPPPDRALEGKAARLGDLDGDGIGDFALGPLVDRASWTAADSYLLLSGRDSRVLEHIPTGHTQVEPGSTTVLVPLGDTDGDGLADFAVLASSWQADRSYVAVYSSRDRSLRYSIAGRSGAGSPPRRIEHGIPEEELRSELEWEEDEPGTPVHDCVALADVDGDGHADFYSSGWLWSGWNGALIGGVEEGRPGAQWQFAGDDLRVWLRHEAENDHGLPGERSDPPWTRQSLPTLESADLVVHAGDVDGDGYAEVLVARTQPLPTDPYGGHPHVVRVSLRAGHEDRVLLSWEQRGRVQGGFRFGPIGDIDGDGRLDYLTRTGPESAACSSVLVVRSGANGRVLLEAIDESPELGETVLGLGDLDGDGREEMLWTDPSARLGPGYGNGLAYVLSWK